MRTRVWLLLSGVAHGALALALTAVQLAPPRRLTAPSHAPIEVELAVEQPRAPLPLAEPPLPVQRSSRLREAASPRRTRPSTAEAPHEAAMENPAENAAQNVVQPMIELSPRAAALTVMEATGEGVSDAGVARVGPLRGEAQRSLEEALMSAVRRVDTRNEPVLRPKPGGGYLYVGNGFEATIESDGSVQMEDRFVSAKWIFRPTTGADGELAGFRIFELKYDIFGWLDRKMGNDPFRSERRWFLDHTRGLREEMIEHFHDKRVHSLEQ